MEKFDHISGKHFAIGEAKIYYEEIGQLDKPPLLLLHGGFGSIEDFNSIVPQIRKEFRIIGIDSRGQGKSTLGKETLTYEQIQNDIEQLLKYLGITHLSVMGFSDGGIVAYRLASFSDLEVTKLITICSRWHKNHVVETGEILRSVNAEKWRARFPGMVSVYEKINPEPDFDRFATKVVNMWLNEGSYPNESVRSIKAETLIVRGDKDHLVKRKFAFDAA